MNLIVQHNLHPEAYEEKGLEVKFMTKSYTEYGQLFRPSRSPYVGPLMGVIFTLQIGELRSDWVGHLV